MWDLQVKEMSTIKIYSELKIKKELKKVIRAINSGLKA